MAVFEPDQRQIVQPSDDEFTDFPLSAVVAVDTQIDCRVGKTIY